MALTDTALLKKVKNHERKALKRNEALLSRISALDDLLEAAYDICCPQPHDYENRRDLIRIFNVITREIYGTGNACPVVEEFGSFVMNMFSSNSDLDLSINFNNHAVKLKKAKRIKTLQTFAKKFYSLESRGHVKNVQVISSAKVPVLKVTDCGTNIECDFSVENRDGIAKSLVVFMIAAIDERFRKLSIMLKAWAKAQGINSSRDGTLNSLSLISLAAFHLQRTNPPILPPFSAIFTDGFDPRSVKRNISPFLNYGQKNKDSFAQHFVTFLIRLKSVETLWAEGLCASIYEGSWIYKTFVDQDRGISVEDFTDRAQNVSRAVRPNQLTKINKCIEKSLSQIKEFLDGKIHGQKLEELLFGPHPTRLTKCVINFDRPVLHDPTPTKRMRLAVDKPIRVNKPGKSFSSGTGGTSQGHGRTVQEAETFHRIESYATQNPSIVGYHPALPNLPLNSSSRPVIGFSSALPGLPLNPSSRPVAGFSAALPDLPLNPSSRPVAGFSPALPGLPLNPSSRPVAGFSPALPDLPLNPSSRPVVGFSPALPTVSSNPSSRSFIGFAPDLLDLSVNPYLGLVEHLLPGTSRAPYPGQVNATQIWLNNPRETPGGARRPPL